MIHEELSDRYFEWMRQLVCGDKDYNHLTYRKLLTYLYNTEFIYIHEMDENRAQDGIDFRYHFGCKKGYSSDIIERYLDLGPCNVLEMMVALAFKGEEQIMYDFEYGDRTGQWFWSMIVSLGLGNMHDRNFDSYYVAETIDRFMRRQYQPNGAGGLFTIENCKTDLRDVEIWSQFMWYLNTIIDDYY